MPAPSTWQRIRRGLAEHSGAPGRAVARAGVILLCLLILAAIVYVFNQALTDLVIRPV